MPIRNDEFTPKLGRMRQGGAKQSKRYLSKVKGVLQARAPGSFSSAARTGFSGTRIGRGAGVGHASVFRRHPFGGFRARRAVVKFRIAPLGGDGFGAARAHLRYIQRDGTQKDGSPGVLFTRDADIADGNAFLDRCEDDRHQFRVILSPEDADQLSNLTDYTRDVMERMERDLGSRLDWVAVNHHNTDNPHVHIVIRGKDERGDDLVIARDYITHGARRRASEVATDGLGLRNDLDIARARRRDVAKERFTPLDRELIDQAENGAIRLGAERTPYDRFQRSQLTGRLATLEAMGLAQKDSSGAWRLSSGLEPTLKRLGRRGDIIRTMQRTLGKEHEAGTFQIFDPGDVQQKAVLGRVAAHGPSDELSNGRFLVIDAIDGYQWHVDVGDPGIGGAPPVGAIVEVKPQTQQARPADMTIDAIARANNGVYTDAAHADADPAASPAYREAHKRRLEALRRQGIVERAQGGAWTIPEDYLAKASSVDARRQGRVRLATLSWLPLEQLVEREAVTWLEEGSDAGVDSRLAGRGFGADLAAAKARRQAWLLKQGYAEEKGDRSNCARRRVLHSRDENCWGKVHDWLGILEKTMRQRSMVNGLMASIAALAISPPAATPLSSGRRTSRSFPGAMSSNAAEVRRCPVYYAVAR